MREMAFRVSFGCAFVVLLVFSLGNAHKAPCKTGDPCIKPSKKVAMPRSCLDHLKRGSNKCGYYKIYDSYGSSFPVYCDMKSEPGNAWTLVISFSTKNRGITQFLHRHFKTNAPVNENAPNWNLYRQTVARMNSIKSHSTHWRATCSYPTYGVDYTDYVRASFKDFDVMTFTGSSICKKVEYINIRGHVGIHTTSQWWQGGYLPHVDSFLSKKCGFKPLAGAVRYEDNFGYYGHINRKFRCTQNDAATTQYWFGGHL